jgi:hypothetical protein
MTFEIEPGDIVVSDARHGGLEIGVHEEGHLTTVKAKSNEDKNEWDYAKEFINEYTKKHHYYPNVWFVDDHGGTELVKDIYESKLIRQSILEKLNEVSSFDEDHILEFRQWIWESISLDEVAFGAIKTGIKGFGNVMKGGKETGAVLLSNPWTKANRIAKKATETAKAIKPPMPKPAKLYDLKTASY